jgi:hypothetical protein
VSEYRLIMTGIVAACGMAPLTIVWPLLDVVLTSAIHGDLELSVSQQRKVPLSWENAVVWVAGHPERGALFRCTIARGRRA